MQDFVNILSNFGFPVTVACYLLFRFEKKLETLEQTNRDLCTKLQALIEAIDDLSNRRGGKK